MRAAAVAVVLTIALANLGAWAWLNRPVHESPWYGTLRGVSFNPYRADQNPLGDRHPTRAEMARDLALLADEVHTVRTYSTLSGLDAVPELARAVGLRVTAGAWLDRRPDRNAEEIRRLVALARANDNVDRLLVGNEALLRGDLTPAELRAHLRQVRAAVDQPVSTAEPWHVWLDHPDLVTDADFIAAHLLPYWEGVPVEDAVAHVLQRYRELEAAFPGVPILVAEVGWPTRGSRFGAAQPGVANQSRFLREFLHAARAAGIDYMLMEAFDQPWKRALEGSVGAHWGLFTAARERKSPLAVETVVERPGWPVQAVLSLVLVLPFALWFAWRSPELRLRGLAFFVALTQLGVSLLVAAAFVPAGTYLGTAGTGLALAMVVAQCALLMLVLTGGFELAELLWKRRMQRCFGPLNASFAGPVPRVSVHLPCHNEPPELVIETLHALARLDYPDFEVIVVDNNTDDPHVWRPVAECCEALGPRFRFYHLQRWPGFKAGALNFALDRTDPRATIIGVVDADYVVEPDWLKALVPYFEDARVGFVQAPQDHRDWRGNLFKTMCNWEYAGFFSIGMVHRNERDAIIQHGTMTLTRREALERAGRWGEWCICEDTELGLRLLARDWRSVYVNHVLGRGVTPDCFEAYRRQRYRWAFGAMQILRHHWRSLLLPRRSTLSAGQRFHFLTGWLPWLADGLHLLFTLGALAWSLGLVFMPHTFEFPLPAFLASVLVLFALKLSQVVVLYRTRVPCTAAQCLGALVAGAALMFIIGRAVLDGLISRRPRPFVRTPKAGDRPGMRQGLAMAREEGMLMLALWIAALAVAMRYGIELREAAFWAGLLVLQSLPYACAVALSLIAVTPRTGARGQRLPRLAALARWATAAVERR